MWHHTSKDGLFLIHPTTKEAEPSRKGGRVLNPSFSGRGRTFLPWRERESENFCCVKFFYIVDQLLMRSLWLEKLSINDFAINSDFHIFLLLKDQTYHYHEIFNAFDL